MTANDEHGIRPGPRPPAGRDGPETGPAVALRRIGAFLSAGWSFHTGLAGRMPGLFLAGGQL
ncbi:hypothetical protein [Nocardia sp. NPDC003345]